jgi:N-methylhydantoinase A
LRGLVQADAFVGGEIQLDIGMAERAVATLADQLDADILDVAQGIYDIANANMMEAIRGVTIYKGIDPREYTLLSYGSAGAQHISAIAGELGIRDVLIPALPGAFSAFGLICSDLKIDMTKSVVRELDHVSDAELTAAFEGLEREAVKTLEEQEGASDDAVIERFIEAYYLGQTWETASRAPLGAFDEAARRALIEEFHATHERLWAFRSEDLPIVLLNVRVAATRPVVRPELKEIESGNGTPGNDAFLYERDVRFVGESRASVPFYRRAALRAGDVIQGPAAVVEKTTITVVLDKDSCTVDQFGNLRIAKGAFNGQR